MLTVNELPVTSQQLAEATRKDTTLAKVYDHTLYGWPRSCTRYDKLYPFFIRKEELSIEDGCIVWGRRLVIPSTHTEHLLHELHTMYPGIVRMKSISRSFIARSFTAEKCPTRRTCQSMAMAMNTCWLSRKEQKDVLGCGR